MGEGEDEIKWNDSSGTFAVYRAKLKDAIILPAHFNDFANFCE